MMTPARHAFGLHDHPSDTYAAALRSELDIVPDDRIGPLRRHRRGGSLAATLLVAIALGGGWMLADARHHWPDWLSETLAAIPSLIERQLPGLKPGSDPALVGRDTVPAAPPVSSEPPAAPETTASAVAASDPDGSSVPAQSVLVASPAAAPVTVVLEPPLASVAEVPALAPQPKPSDPRQARAVAAGLHPELSPVLLSRLSQTDFRNAGIAIRNALAAGKDDAVYVWPRPAELGRALYHVYFVPGAAEGCRRYVVTIAKDGWETTALPMERCGAAADRQQARAAQ